MSHIMLMAVDEQVHTVLIEQLLDSISVGTVVLLYASPEGRGRIVTVPVTRTVDGAVRVHDNPRGL